VSGGQDKNVRVWKDIAELPQGWEDLSAKKRAKREERGEVKTSGNLSIANSQTNLST
jgi:hypothetical protein